MKKLLSLLLALTVMLSMFACTEPDKSDITPTGDGDEPPVDDGLVTIYLPVSRTEYKADGSKGHKQELYTYTDKGLLLTHTVDTGALQEAWNEEDGIYDYVAMPFDGNPDMKVEITYDDRGDMLRCIQTTQEYSMGAGFVTRVKDSAKDYAYSYFHLPDGRVDYVERQDLRYTDIPTFSPDYIRCHYDDVGRLTGISLEMSQYIYGDIESDLHDYIPGMVVVEAERAKQDRYYYSRTYSFQYNAQGQLSVFTNYVIGRDYTYRYEYNPAGQLVRMTRSRGQDDAYWGEVVFVYDAQGCLTARLSYDEKMKLIGEQTFQYRNGKLYKIIYKSGKKVIITTDESETGTADVTLIEDSKGNVVKRIEKNGGFQWFEYKAFRLTPEEAQIAQRSLYCYHQLGLDGKPSSDGQLPQLEPGLSACLTVPFPVTTLFFYDIALKD